MSSDFAPSPLLDPIAHWRDALDNLSPHASPCRYLLPNRWATIRENALAFCDQFGAEAHRLGWMAPELFAVHPEHSTVKPEAYGALMPETSLQLTISVRPWSKLSATRSRPPVLAA